MESVGERKRERKGGRERMRGGGGVCGSFILLLAFFCNKPENNLFLHGKQCENMK